MKKRLILILTVVALCVTLIGSAVAVALSAITLDDTPSPTEDAPVGNEQIPTEDLAVSTTLPNHIFYQDSLHADPAGWPSQCSSVVMGDYVLVTVNGQDPYYTLRANDPYKAGKYAAVYYSTSNAYNCSVQFYMGMGGGPQNDSTMKKAPLTVDGEWHQVIIDVSNLISSEGTAEYFRMDPLTCDSGSIPSGATIALKYVAFFDTEADAKGFDYDAYLRYLNGEPLEEVKWPNPTYQEKTDVTSADTAAGSLKYTTSADGSQVTISYTTGTKTHTYTVPNDNNYLFGGFAGTDDLDRTLHDASQVGVIGDNGEKHVGIFYFLWHGDSSVNTGGCNALYDLQKIIDTHGTTKAGKVSSGLYGDVGTVHWFAEPLYGYYHTDPWVMRKHAELLTNAGVDFLYFDVTNGFTYTSQAVRMMSILHDLNEQGYDAPEVMFYTNSQSHNAVTTLYNDIYAKNIYPDTWFCIDGKPVIVCTERSDNLRESGTIDANIKNFFYTKESQWPVPLESKQTNGWPWMDFDWPQNVFTDASGGDRTMNISIAQHRDYSNAYTFSSSSLYGNSKNRGRSYGSTAAQVASWSSSLGTAYYNAYTADKSMSNYGYNFQAQWDHAIKSNIEFALVTGWNEWIAQRQDGATFLKDADKVVFVDAASVEFSRDAEMMRGGYFDNYYMQLIYNIERFKGDAPVIMQDSRKPINVTGEFNQWDSVLVNYTDPSGDTVNRNGKGYGDVTYTNETGRNDIVSSKITHDTKNVYFYAQTNATISMYNTDSSWMQLYLDTDRNANTGWYGYDYIVNYKASGHFTTSVAKYTGSNNSFSFTNVGTVPYRVSGNQMMIEVPMSMLGISAYDDINMEFKWADSDTTYSTMEQFYTDGDVAPLGRLNYVYQTYIPGEKVAHTCSFGAWTTTTPATCTAEGTQTRTCTGCGKAETQSIAKTAHTEVTVAGTAATCVAEGKTEGTKCSVCQTVIVAQQSIPAKGHTEVSIPVTPATCTETGLTAGSSCSVCGEILMAQTVIPATGHTVITLGAQEATCTTPGLTEGKKCVICQTVTVAQQTIPAKGHTNNNGDLSCDTCGAPMDCAHSNLNDPVKEKEVAATCTTAGSYDLVVYCSTCHIEMSRETVSVDAKGHTEVTVSGTAATCTAEGKTDGKKCSVCQTVTVAQQTISALGHTDTNGDEVCDRCSASLSTACQHSYVATTTDATCTTAGKTVETCSKCGDTKTTTIPAKGHTEVTVNGTAATCTAAGKTEGKKCSVCQTVTVPQQTIPALGHADTNGDKVCDRCGTSLSTACTHNYVTTTTEATCTESGKIVERCSKCGDTKTTTIPAKGHTEVTVNGTAATCTESGLTDGKKCSVCDEIISAQETIPATGHTEITVSAKAPTCTKEGLTEGKKCSVCQTVTVPQDTIPAKGHSEQVTPAVGATCITNGKTEGVYCEICGETLVAQVAIPATGHVETTVSGTHATCTESGLTDGSKCAVCGDTLIVQTTIPAAGHVEETVKGTAPTCTETGLTDGKKCSVCDTILTQQTTIPAQGHSEQILEGKDPTCTATGLTGGKQCTTCGVVLEQQTSIDATGHTAGEWIVDTEPTVESAGQRIKKCTVCDEIVAIEPIAALPAPDTEPVTTEPVTTEPVTKPVTTAPVTSENAGSDTGDNDVTSAPVSTDVADEGCGSTVSVSAFVLLGSILALAGTCLLRRKKHGEA